MFREEAVEDSCAFFLFPHLMLLVFDCKCFEFGIASVYKFGKLLAQDADNF